MKTVSLAEEMKSLQVTEQDVSTQKTDSSKLAKKQQKYSVTKL